MAVTEMQTLILWSLLVHKDGAGFQKDIRPDVKKPDREALVSTGLIAVRKRGRGYWLEVTDKGWSWAAEHLDSALPKRSTAGCLILQVWLTRLKRFMESRNFVLADVLGAQPEPMSDSQAPRGSVDYETLRSRVRSAYLEIAGTFNTRVLLSDLRERLKDIDRALLDQTLCRMHPPSTKRAIANNIILSGFSTTRIIPRSSLD